MKDIQIAAILDIFTYTTFSFEVDILQLSPHQWQKEIDNKKIDFLFVESAWRGKDGLWENKINKPSIELQEIIDYCTKQHIPTVFWNKEDPFHFYDFIETASLFDYIFTTDIRTISYYKKYVKHDNISLLPFACQPKIHNPIEVYKRKNAFVFAGAYYPRFKIRNKQFHDIINIVTKYASVDIYDRNYNIKNTPLKFPSLFASYIRGSLEYSDIDKAYKGYKYAINLNSITDSPTMFSRRVLELMASNTLVISNYSKGMKLFLGDLVFSSKNNKDLDDKIKNILDNTLKEQKIKVLALRKIMTEHTAEKRIEDISTLVLGNNKIHKEKHVLCIGYAKAINEIEQLKKTFKLQTYQNKSLIIVTSEEFDIAEEDKIVYILENNYHINQYDFQQYQYIAAIHPNDYYGENYLFDLMLALKYTNAEVISKSGVYEYTSNHTPVFKNTSPYTYGNIAPIRSSIIKLSLVSISDIINFVHRINDGEYNDLNVLYIDAFNYCKNGFLYNISKNNQKIIDDLENYNVGIKYNYIFKEKLIKKRNNLDILFKYMMLKKKMIFVLKKYKSRIGV